ncbi:MAG: CobW family GTP-binding protein [Pseudomonadota bacterium]|nr:CobW family GTP-binding protein [Pseudomonadota bacterium]
MNISSLAAINLITGPLGSGKTTLLRHLLNLKPEQENWVLLVNEFGSVGIDGAILAETPSVRSIQLPGGCICCTAKSELTQTLQEVIEQYHPHRIFIEPTGLGEPDTLVEILQSEDFKNKLEIQTLFAVLDSANTSLKEIHDYTIMQNLLNMADVVVLNKTDLATSDQLETLQNYCQALYPAKRQILQTQQGKIAIKWLDHLHATSVTTNRCTTDHSHGNQTKNNGVMLPYMPITFSHPVERLYKQELGVQSIGYIFSDQATFDWKKLFILFQSLNETQYFPGLKRAKGVLKVGSPWMLFQWVNQQTTREYICYRRDSRLELLIESDQPFNFQEFEQRLQSCIL